MQPNGRGQPLKHMSGLAELPAIEKDELSTTAGGDPFKPSSMAVLSPLAAADGAEPFMLGSAAKFTWADMCTSLGHNLRRHENTSQS